MTTPLIDCGRLDLLLPDHLEGTLGADERASVQRHLGSCDRCSALVADLAALRDEASALPVLRPSRDLWSGIADRIEAPVVALPLAARAASRRDRRWIPLSAAAAALILITATLTYTLTVRSVGRATGSVAVRSAAPQPVASSIVAPESVTTVAVTTTPPATRSPESPSTGTSRKPSRGIEQAEPGVERSVSTVSLNISAAAIRRERAYGREIATLRQAIAERRDQLDPHTIAVLEASLAVIDSAIAQSRAALAADPGSAFLSTQLDRAESRKLELLRTAALLPIKS